MILQYLLLSLIVGAAAWYIIKKVRAPFHSKKDCGGGCAKCSALDKIQDIKK